MSRPTHQQLQALANFLELNPGIAKGLLRTAHAKQETKRKWDEVSVALNSLGGAQKDGKGWAKYWADKKCALKKTCAQHAQSRRITGGGTDSLSVLSPLDEQLVAVMGGSQFAVGDSHVAVNPFPTTSQEVEIEMLVESHINIPHTSPEPNNEDTVTETIPETNSIRRSRTRLNKDREVFANIEQKRVEAEMKTAQALADAVNQLAGVKQAFENVTIAIRESSQTIANALNNIADALRSK